MEYIDIVNKQDETVGKISFDKLYQDPIPMHRIVHIMLFNSKGEMGLQFRSKEKSYFPESWSTAVGGHMNAGETYEVAGLREMREEIGIQTELKNFNKLTLKDTERNFEKFLGVFEAFSDESLTLAEDEVADFQFFSIKKIKEMIKKGERFHPELTFIINELY